MGVQRSRCAPFAFGALSMGATLPVQVRSKGDHPDRSEPQLQKGDRLWGGSGERNRGLMNKNPIRGDAEQGERANDREAPDGLSSGGVDRAAVR